MRENLEIQLKNLGLQSKTSLPGFVNDVEIYLDKSDVFVFSSLWEGFGIVLIEALARNLTIVSTDCEAGPREILAPNLDLEEKVEYPYYGKYGILVPDLNKQQEKGKKILAETMNELYENEELKKRYSKNYKRAEDFNKEKITDEWEKIMEDKNI